MCWPLPSYPVFSAEISEEQEKTSLCLKHKYRFCWPKGLTNFILIDLFSFQKNVQKFLLEIIIFLNKSPDHNRQKSSVNVALHVVETAFIINIICYFWAMVAICDFTL